MILQQLRHTALPICSDAAGNHVRKHLEDMLVRRLGFPRELANDYSKHFSIYFFVLKVCCILYLLHFLADVVCRFFSALHRAYHLPVTENFHSALRVDGAHSYFQGEEHFEALQRALSLDRQFDTMFLDQILEKFAAGKVQRSWQSLHILRTNSTLSPTRFRHSTYCHLSSRSRPPHLMRSSFNWFIQLCVYNLKFVCV